MLSTWTNWEGALCRWQSLGCRRSRGPCRPILAERSFALARKSAPRRVPPGKQCRSVMAGGGQEGVRRGSGGGQQGVSRGPAGGHQGITSPAAARPTPPSRRVPRRPTRRRSFARPPPPNPPRPPGACPAARGPAAEEQRSMLVRNERV
eukprot:1105745-Prorocentrum_minimum.AAC.1